MPHPAIFYTNSSVEDCVHAPPGHNTMSHTHQICPVLPSWSTTGLPSNPPLTGHLQHLTLTLSRGRAEIITVRSAGLRTPRSDWTLGDKAAVGSCHTQTLITSSRFLYFPEGVKRGFSSPLARLPHPSCLRDSNLFLLSVSRVFLLLKR